MNLQCILCNANSSYAVEIPKDKVTCNKYWNFYKKLKIWEDGRQPLKMGVSHLKWEGWNKCHLLPLLEELSHGNKQILIMGDFNINLLNCDDKNTANFLDTIFSYFYLPFITHPLE